MNIVGNVYSVLLFVLSVVHLMLMYQVLISFSYSNHLQDDIDMSLEFDFIKGFYCNECHTDINPVKLESAISEALPDSLKAKRKDGNMVTISI